MVTLTRLDSTQPDFKARLARLLQFDDAADAAIEQTVAGILHDVKKRGDAAVLEYTERFDRLPAASLASLELTAAQLQTALDAIASRYPPGAGSRSGPCAPLSRAADPGIVDLYRG